MLVHTKLPTSFFIPSNCHHISFLWIYLTLLFILYATIELLSSFDSRISTNCISHVRFFYHQLLLLPPCFHFHTSFSLLSLPTLISAVPSVIYPYLPYLFLTPLVSKSLFFILPYLYPCLTHHSHPYIPIHLPSTRSYTLHIIPLLSDSCPFLSHF